MARARGEAALALLELALLYAFFGALTALSRAYVRCCPPCGLSACPCLCNPLRDLRPSDFLLWWLPDAEADRALEDFRRRRRLEGEALAVAEEFMGANWTAVGGHLWGEDYALFAFRGFARVNGTAYCFALVEVDAAARRVISAELRECGEGGRALRLRG